ncbi:MAG: AAA family ATPase, partial [Desulfomonilaceae bacterium]
MSSFIEELDHCIRARFTLICVVSLEEESILEQLRTLCANTNRRLYRWDHADYFQVLCGDGSAPNAKDPLSALAAIEHLADDAIVALCDFHQCWHGQPRVVRKLR